MNHNHGEYGIFDAVVCSAECTKDYISRGVDYNSIEDQGRGDYTPLHVAVNCYREDEEERYKIIDILLENGVFIDSRTSSGKTPLHCVVRYQNIKCVKLFVEFLLRKGADPNAVDDDGFTSLHHLLFFYYHDNHQEILEMVKLLLSFGADPTISDKNGDRPRDMDSATDEVEKILDEWENDMVKEPHIE